MPVRELLYFTIFLNAIPLIFVADCMKDERIDALFSKISLNISSDSLSVVNFAMNSVSELHIGRDPGLRPRQAGSLKPYVAHADIANEKISLNLCPGKAEIERRSNVETM
jgi:hypothetical protein